MLAYSTVGRTNNLKACSLIEVDAMLTFLWTKLRFLLALLQMLKMLLLVLANALFFFLISTPDLFYISNQDKYLLINNE